MVCAKKYRRRQEKHILYTDMLKLNLNLNLIVITIAEQPTANLLQLVLSQLIKTEYYKLLMLIIVQIVSSHGLRIHLKLYDQEL